MASPLAVVFHTTASNTSSTVEDIMRYFLQILRQDKGGYHVIIDREGKAHWLYDPFSGQTTYGIAPNAALGLSNANTLHVSYIGGINNQNPNQAVCNITPEQEKATIQVFKKIAKRYPKIKFVGHQQVNLQREGPSLWLPDLLRAWGFPEKHISDVDPFGKKEQIRNLPSLPGTCQHRTKKLKKRSFLSTLIFLMIVSSLAYFSYQLLTHKDSN